jgi:hypothetical protein
MIDCVLDFGIAIDFEMDGNAKAVESQFTLGEQWNVVRRRMVEAADRCLGSVVPELDQPEEEVYIGPYGSRGAQIVGLAREVRSIDDRVTSAVGKWMSMAEPTYLGYTLSHSDHEQWTRRYAPRQLPDARRGTAGTPAGGRNIKVIDTADYIYKFMRLPTGYVPKRIDADHSSAISVEAPSLSVRPNSSERVRCVCEVVLPVACRINGLRADTESVFASGKSWFLHRDGVVASIVATLVSLGDRPCDIAVSEGRPVAELVTITPVHDRQTRGEGLIGILNRRLARARGGVREFTAKTDRTDLGYAVAHHDYEHWQIQQRRTHVSTSGIVRRVPRHDHGASAP